MNHKTVIDLLIAERNRILAEKEGMIQHFNSKISEVERAIVELSGEKAWEISNEVIDYGKLDKNEDGTFTWEFKSQNNE